METIPSDALRVFVVAPKIISWGLERLLSALSRIEYTGSASSLAEARESMGAGTAEVVVVDFDDNQVIDDLIAFQSSKSCTVLLLTSSHDTSSIDRAVIAGIRAVVLKNDAPQILIKAIRAVHEGTMWIDRNAVGRIFKHITHSNGAHLSEADQVKIALLTTRERQAIAAVASDTVAPGKVIASRMCISEHTLRNHLSSIYTKLGLQNRADLYAFATKNRLHLHNQTRPFDRSVDHRIGMR